ncbi:MAG TPA: DUF6753 family protein [Stenomitos sp.]
MTRRISKAEREKVTSLLAQYLEGRSETFQNKVYELVVRYSWDVNDPSFAILLATGQMETILESFPEQFEALFLRLMQESQQRFIEHRKWFESQKSDLKNYIQGLESEQSQSIAQIQGNIDSFNKALEEHRQWHLNALNKALKVASEHRNHLFDEVKAHLTTLEYEFTKSAQSHARDLIQNALTIWRGRTFKEILCTAGGIGGIILTIGIFLGVMINQKYVDQFSDKGWAMKLWKWNEDNYAACVEARKTTCNFHIVPPKKK